MGKLAFPHWNQHFRIPSVGDDVMLDRLMILAQDPKLDAQFEISVQPRSIDGKLQHRAHSIKALFQRAEVSAAKLIGTYIKTELTEEQIENARLDLKSLIETWRAALDYAAHYIADRCNPKPSPRRIFFPIAEIGESRESFERKLRRYFPGLEISAPLLHQYLIEIQEFDDEPWLQILGDLARFNKHHALSEEELARFDSILISFADVGIRLGEFGLRSLTLKDHGKLRFVGACGESAELSAPIRLDVNTFSLPENPRITLSREPLTLYRIINHRSSVVREIWRFHVNVFRAVDKVCCLLSA